MRAAYEVPVVAFLERHDELKIGSTRLLSDVCLADAVPDAAVSAFLERVAESAKARLSSMISHASSAEIFLKTAVALRDYRGANKRLTMQAASVGVTEIAATLGKKMPRGSMLLCELDSVNEYVLSFAAALGAMWGGEAHGWVAHVIPTVLSELDAMNRQPPSLLKGSNAVGNASLLLTAMQRKTRFKSFEAATSSDDWKRVLSGLERLRARDDEQPPRGKRGRIE